MTKPFKQLRDKISTESKERSIKLYNEMIQASGGFTKVKISMNNRKIKFRIWDSLKIVGTEVINKQYIFLVKIL